MNVARWDFRDQMLFVYDGCALVCDWYLILTSAQIKSNPPSNRNCQSKRKTSTELFHQFHCRFRHSNDGNKHAKFSTINTYRTFQMFIFMCVIWIACRVRGVDVLLSLLIGLLAGCSRWISIRFAYFSLVILIYFSWLDFGAFQFVHVEKSKRKQMKPNEWICWQKRPAEIQSVSTLCSLSFQFTVRSFLLWRNANKLLRICVLTKSKERNKTENCWNNEQMKRVELSGTQNGRWKFRLFCVAKKK